jgi:hypothetical protein
VGLTIAWNFQDWRHCTTSGYADSKEERQCYKEIPSTAEDVASVSVNHKRWNFRDESDAPSKCRAATA